MRLIGYVTSRVAVYLLVLFVAITTTFFLPRLMPSDPIENYISQLQNQAGQSLTPQQLEDLRRSLAQLYGLEGSLSSQYLSFIKRVLVSFDFGPSFSAFPTPVSELIGRALPWTLGLLGICTLFGWLLGNLVGLVAGFYHNSRAAVVLEVVGVILYPIPYYILALVLILVFGYIWRLFPLSTTILPGPLTLQKMGNVLRNSILPGMTLVLARFGWEILGMKALAYAAKEEDFATYARLKGVRPWRIMVTYVFRNAMLPQVTALALSMGGIFSGALVAEMLFSYPGLGLLMRSAIGNGDFNLLYGTATMTILAVATAALAIDLLYPLLDPRIRYR